MRRWFLLFFISYAGLFCEVDEPSVLIITVPKAGTHLLHKIMTNLFSKKVVTMYFPARNGNVRPFTPGRQPSVVLTHLMSDLTWVNNPGFANFRKVLLVRDPRDVVVSFYYHLTKRNGWPLRLSFTRDKLWNMGSLEEKVNLMLASPENTPIDGIHSSLMLLHDPNVLVVRFEDLVGAQGGGSDEVQWMTLMNLASFIGRPKTLEEIKEVSPRLFGGTWTFRKGQIGEWKNFFTPGHLETLKALIGHEVIELGYATDYNW